MTDLQMAPPDNEDLLVALAAALAATAPVLPHEPSPASITALRRAVGQPRPGRTRVGRGRRIAFATSAVIGVVAGGTGVAFATGTAPQPVRAAVYDLGFPVASPALSDARNDEAGLRAALARVVPGDPTAARDAAEQAARLSAQLTQLDGSDRRKLGAMPVYLIGQARSVELNFDLAPTRLPDSTGSVDPSDKASAHGPTYATVPSSVDKSRPDRSDPTSSDDDSGYTGPTSYTGSGTGLGSSGSGGSGYDNQYDGKGHSGGSSSGGNYDGGQGGDQVSSHPGP